MRNKQRLLLYVTQWYEVVEVSLYLLCELTNLLPNDLVLIDLGLLNSLVLFMQQNLVDVIA